jgi:type I restriction-modification system DNA methylase subunit
MTLRNANLPVMNHVSFIWNIAESLRGPFKPAEYGSVVLPFTVLRRLDAVLADTKQQVLEAAKSADGMPDVLRDMKLREASGHEFFNTSPAVMGVRDETPQFVDDMLGDSGLFAELSKALPAMLYEFLKQQSEG